ncbi:unnamed protein product [Anisakis simplex]|uniref:cyclin-dependent kinase n=1 Tax=Anisakis simplex TaxID=6269 RepID=A0A0M3K666_ANISI|nr:unnamed protein product [Anisakis simplex]
MSSPSDDGQCTDTDREEESTHVAERNAAESEETQSRKTSSRGDGSISGGILSDADAENIDGKETQSRKTSSRGDGSISGGILSDADAENIDGSEHEHVISDGSEHEDEEMRLRRKLLEKRAVAATSSGNTLEPSSPPMPTRGDEVDRRYEKRKHDRLLSPQAVKKTSPKRSAVDAVNDDEEMFSMQPKDAATKDRVHSSIRLSAERERDRDRDRSARTVLDRTHRRDEQRPSKEERHRRKERKREKHQQQQQEQQRFRDRDREKYKRDYEIRETLSEICLEDRSRHSSGKQLATGGVREFVRLAGRVQMPESKAALPRSSSEKIRKEKSGREVDNIKVERHSKDAYRIRSPRKRDASPIASKQRNSKPEMPPAKKTLVERQDAPVKSETAYSDGGTANVIETQPEHKVKLVVTAVANSAKEIDSDKVNDVQEVSKSDNEGEKNSVRKSDHEPSPSGGPSKYSKFDSSPEEEEKSKVIEENLASNAITTTTDSEAESDVILRASDDEMESVGEEEEFDEEKLAQYSPDTRERLEAEQQQRLIAKLPVYYPGISGCRNVAEFECLNRIEEGTFGVVYRAKEKKTDEVVALKRLKMEKEKEGFPITSLREINMLLKAGNHPNIVNVRVQFFEIVVGSTMDKIYLVMEYVEHDMKSLMDLMHSRKKHFTIGQVKTLLHQLLSGVAHMHDQWILHRDLKTSNLLLSHKGILKIGDFGLAREFGDPLKAYTPIVVTLWYRSPELLLGVKVLSFTVKEYSKSVDMWSCGCIFAEFLRLKPLFPGKGELDQINKIFLELGTPSEKIWPGYNELPGSRKMKFEHHEYNQLWKKFPTNVVDKKGLDFLNELLRYDPQKRLTAHQALTHIWFDEDPPPTPPELFPTWPAKSELGRAVVKSPITKAPSNPKDIQDAKLYRELRVEPPAKTASTGFALKFDAVKFGD